MAYKKGVVGFGYLDSVLRIESRPSVKPLSRNEILQWLDTMVEAGVDAWKYSVSGKGSIPLFPSKVLPYRAEFAEEGYYQWVVEQAHARGITILSWEYMNAAPLLTAEHPDCRVKFLGWDDQRKDRDNHFACFLSPYGQLLKDFCVEVVNDLGFDGLWLDGSCMFGWGGMFRNRWFCCCDRCAQAFEKATGLDCPQAVDWNDNTFRRFVQWRYDFFENYWVELADYVRQRNPDALIVCNYFNRHYYGAMSGSPLRHRPMEAMISSEDTFINAQMQLRVNRAVSGRHPVETYAGLATGARPIPPFCPNPNPTASIYFAKSAAAVGGWTTFGADPLTSKHSLSEISTAMKPVAPYIGGEPVRLCGLVFSGATKDFAHLNVVPATNSMTGPESFDTFHLRHKPTVDMVWGVGFLLNALHWPFEVVLENQLSADELAQYPIVILPDVQCMDNSAAVGIAAYVRAGGTLLVTGQAGTKDLFGRPRQTSVLDDLLGITFRSDHLRPCEMEILTDELGGGDLPGRFMISGEARLVATAEDVIIHARATDAVSSPDTHVAICERKVGKGRALFIASDIGSGYSQNPNRRTRETVRRLIGAVRLPYETDAPANVQITAWHKDGNLVFHLLNQPSSMVQMIGTQLDYAPEDFTPTAPIHLTVTGHANRIFSPTGQGTVTAKQSGANILVTLSRLDMHDVIVLEKWCERP